MNIKEQDTFTKYNELHISKHKNINSNICNFEREIGTLNFNNQIDLRNRRKINNSIKTEVFIEENIIQLNEKLKAASEFYKINLSNDFERSKNDMTNRDLGKSSNAINNFNESGNHVSKYIKKFLLQAHEVQQVEEIDVFNMQNCKINSKRKFY